MQHCALQQREAVPLAARAGVHAEAEFGRLRGAVERQVREPDELEVGRMDAEDAVAREIDALDILVNRLVPHGTAEAKPPVFRRQLQ